ncbi:MAG: hypothetical protein WCA08_19160 [Desulfoferrobacter sp.]
MNRGISNDEEERTRVRITKIQRVPIGGRAHAVSYYRCGSGWYNQAYSGSGVTYVVVNPPAGY